MGLGLGDDHYGDSTPLAFPTSPFPNQPTQVAAVDGDGNGTVDILVFSYRRYGTA